MLMSILSENCTNNNYQASDDYITRLFDDFSTSFESSLEKLEYHAPSLLTKAIFDLNKFKYSVLIDLGCGTGLFGAMLSNYTNFNIGYNLGVDLSSKMLKLAAEKKINNKKVYSNLYAGSMTKFICALAKYRHKEVQIKVNDYSNDIVDVDDIVNNGFDKHFLKGNKQLLNENPLLVVAADVFVYVGDLDSVFESFFELKKKDDVFAFTTEALSEDNENKSFKLQANGRYAHKKSYIDKLIEKYEFSIVKYESVILRKELGNNVNGHLYLFK
jgi:predicted TPR repeat methyltransferase